MFKLVEWAYSLGVKHERRRISSFLTQELLKSKLRLDLYQNGYKFRNQIDHSESLKEYNNRMNQQSEVEIQLQKIIDGIFHVHKIDTTEIYKSVMFPEGDE
jgi:hypothetical protein